MNRSIIFTEYRPAVKMVM